MKLTPSEFESTRQQLLANVQRLEVTALEQRDKLLKLKVTLAEIRSDAGALARSLDRIAERIRPLNGIPETK